MATGLALVHPKLLNPDNPIRSLSLAFWLWKALLFLVIIGCPGPGYDTSTGLLPYQESAASDAKLEVIRHAPFSSPLKLVRWDSIYFIHIVRDDYVFEQEWAFGYGYTRLISFLTSVALVAITLSHITHYFSVLALYRLSINIFGHDSTSGRLISFLSAALHIICPAGAFLSAPYGESLFSFLNITGYYLYSASLLDANAGKRASSDANLLLAAALLSIATAVRSNGILSGALFAYDALLQLRMIISQGISGDNLLRLGVIVVGGCVVALGLIVPQWIAYTAFCMSDEPLRPWCEQLIPSIYGWVQVHYWNVGFLRYWTLSNLPLFILAFPMLFLLCRSSIWALNTTWPSDTGTSLLTRLAAPNGLLAVMAFTSYHVQIINRISSGYPLWYWYLICKVLSHVAGPSSLVKRSQTFTIAVQGMVIYAVVQAVLFGSFLPPA
ncbi:GPI mannosyltransferase 2 [Aspergillus pseudotamarii]|uniref:GPI mannosyltransferase 2 n=1 Tax=Aspergillus pseudotamarii TaxID=132259 RepID=A0A5N6SCB3_ASPPS|nr:GPI mannosyltransferase 2 [Aspergillus pseudotamarii]KAE8132352.1 GPI mannosyltransferase 2 [Aspergillus pseudotamarii]